MKKIVLGFVLAVFLIGLYSFSYYNTSNDPTTVRLCEYKLNGHYYVTATTGASYSGVGIIHSPNCNCGKK